ncbi:uncharacterized protein MELLADRAFT_67198 [Melampsora larici-populina 98AG31]|uniref:Uncharacterized protein n=1 Tax=Melampsora larici-populina (strain 98AG31 / pathotype 3-4-7) TaxID=747676 RepID=F4S259_MELLP|nr:uncharacterized protein MELLADRAFT_67198 [Melampsora larici-populina 98AG31]EGG01314.1 hypothetical protein MELLADRAFT_67198 [Melampsora larici-populina 98AG31]
MPPRQKKNQAHRVVCLCQAYECSEQVYADANGLSHPGVEVSPETRLAHQQADFRNSLINPPHTPDNSNEPSMSSVQEALLSPLRKLHLDTTPSPIRRRQSNTNQEPQNESSSNIDNNAQDAFTSSGPTDSPITSTNQTNPVNSQPISTKTCSTAVLAKASGQQVFDCGL